MEYTDKMQHRIKRIEGQLRGILRMMENNEECKDVTTQLSATRSAIDRVIGVVVSANLIDCMERSEDDSAANQDLVEEAVKLLVKSR
ncbi:metal-sensitive transcriptional regulator [Exiguobacterium flavidum]|uniref:metal-sensitive transcriptional regulator n=1 Tax=Exiguobacterium flavidum TaxID=2184695 RepID=UPI000DF8213A|nr:metal-sensitive transcriptional regulator [Exiguobacterium flavidum]